MCVCVRLFLFIAKDPLLSSPIMKLELRDFVEATKQLHQQSGVKRTRLMLRVRPHSQRKTFVLKATDGQTTLTTRVEHQGQLKLVESVVNDFVTRCTTASVPSAPPPATTQTEQTNTAAAAAAAGQNEATTKEPSAPSHPSQPQHGGGGGHKKGNAGGNQGGSGGNKNKKGKR